MPPDRQDSSGVQVAVQVLGGFAVTVDGSPVPDQAWPTRRSVDLARLLSLAPQRRLVADQVIDALWPHLAPEAGGANLRKAAHHVRRALDLGDAVVLRGGTVALLPNATVSVDAADFEAAADEALRTGEGLDEAIDLYRGDLLPDALYDEWTQSPRRRLRARLLDMLRAAGRWERVVELEPTDEAATRELMQGSLDAGDPHRAIRWYGQLRAALVAELGVAPSPDTDALYERSVTALGSGDPAFIGRDLALAEATASLRRAAETPTTIVVRGAGGIGKSAFCRRLAAVADSDGWLTAITDAHEARLPYGPMTAIVEQLVDRDRALVDALSARARSTLGELTSVAAAAGAVEGPITRHQVIGAVRRLLSVAAPPVGVLVVFDDIHAADEATIDAVFHLASAASRPIVVVVAHRSEGTPPSLQRAVARVVGAGRATVIDLEPLDEGEATALVSAAASRPLEDDELARILDLGEGNPFFLLELVRQTGRPGSVAATTAWEAVRGRFADLDEASAAMLRRLALAGDEFDVSTVLALTGLDDTAAFGLLDMALATGVLAVSGDRYRFRHGLLREALIEQLAPHHRVSIHRDAARRLADLGAPAGIVAGHWLAGRRPDEARPWLLRAARRGIAVGAYLDAVHSLDDLLAHTPDDAEALALRAEALDALGDSGTPAAYEAAAIADPDRSDDLRARQALAELKLGQPTRALETARDLAPSTLDGQLALALTLSGAAAIGFADPVLGSAKAAEGRRLAIRSGDTTAVLVASWAHAAAAHARGELRESVLADLTETADVQTLAITVFDGQLCITQRLLYGARPYDDVIAFADALASEAQRLHNARGHAFAVTLRGEAELLSGRLDDAEIHLRTGAELHRAIGAATGEAHAVQRRAEVAVQRGLLREAAVLTEEALAIARESDVGFHLLDRIYGTRIAAAAMPADALAALDEAESAIRGPMETCPGCRITFAVPAAIAAARAGDVDRADAYAEATDMLATTIMRLPAWHAAHAEVRGHLAAACGRRDDALRHFESAAAIFTEAGHPLDAQRCSRLAAEHR